jgi:hypothetical protein
MDGRGLGISHSRPGAGVVRWLGIAPQKPFAPLPKILATDLYTEYQKYWDNIDRS